MTGAGKSIILNALEFILGGKGSPSLIRTGAESLEVQALFDLAVLPPEVRSELPEIVEDPGCQRLCFCGAGRVDHRRHHHRR